MSEQGRPPFEITEQVLKDAESFAALGLTKAQVAASLGISKSTLMKYQAENTDFSDALKRGRDKSVAIAVSHLMQQSKAGKTTATIFFLKNRDPENWKDRVPEGAGSQEPTPVRVVFGEIDGRVNADS